MSCPKPSSSWTPTASALLLCLVATGCGICERVDDTKTADRSAADLATLLPQSVDAAFFAGTWKDVRDASNLLDRKIGKQVPVQAGVAEVNSAWGLDFNDIPSVQQKGVAVDRGLGVAIVDKQQVYLIPLEAGPGFSKHLASFGKQRYGAFEQAQTRELIGPNGQKVAMSYLVKAGADPQQAPALDDKNLVMAWIVRDSTAIVFPGPASSQPNDKPAADILQKLAFLTEADNLTKNPDFDKVKASVGKDYPIFGMLNAKAYLQEQASELGQAAFGQTESGIYQKLAEEVTYLGVGIKADDSAVAARFHVLMRPETAQRLVAASSSAADPKPLLKSLDGRPAVTLKLASNPEAALKELRAVLNAEDREDLDRALRASKSFLGVDLQQELFPALDGNIFVNLYGADLMALMALNQGDLGAFFLKSSSAMTLGLKDRARLVASLDSAQKTLPPGAIQRVEESGVIVYSFHEPAAVAPEPDPAPPEGGEFQLKLDKFDPKAADSKAQVDPQLPPAPAAGEPLALLIVGDKAALLASPRLDRKQAITLATLGGPGLEAPLNQERLQSFTAAQSKSGLIIDVERFVGLLGPQGLMAGQALRPFDAWMLTLEGAPDGLLVHLNLGFKPEAPGAVAPNGSGAPGASSPASIPVSAPAQ